MFCGDKDAGLNELNDYSTCQRTCGPTHKLIYFRYLGDRNIEHLLDVFTTMNALCQCLGRPRLLYVTPRLT